MSRIKSMFRDRALPMGGVLLAGLLLPGIASAQLTATALWANPPSDLVDALLGPGVTVSNVVYQGTVQSSGFFSGGTSVLGFEDGIVLGNGFVEEVIGTHFFLASNFLSLPGDATLETINGGIATFDATILEFDFVTTQPQISFQYVFTSEEYNNYVNSGVNDVFGFFLNGVNVALLPDGVTPVSIDTVNNCVNQPFFIDNEGGGTSGCPFIGTSADLPTAMDGLTTVFTLSVPVAAGVTHHIKLAIADSGDDALDSNVFIRAGSFTSVDPSATWTQTPTATQTMTPTQTPTETNSPTRTLTSTLTATQTATVTPMPTVTPTATCIPVAFPNPYDPRFAVGALFKLDCLQPGDEAVVYTLTGEAVVDALPLVPSGAFGGTTLRAQWDGRNRQGAAAAPGVYYYAVTNGGRVRASGKFLVMRSP